MGGTLLERGAQLPHRRHDLLGVEHVRPHHRRRRAGDVVGRHPGLRQPENVDARNVGAVGVDDCGSFQFGPSGSEFSIVDLGGDDGWPQPWMLPNTSTCDDRPPVVPPPAPSPWS